MTILKDVTLICVDCVDVTRAIGAMEQCWNEDFSFATMKLLTTSSNCSFGGWYPWVKAIEPITNIRDYSKFMIKELHNYVETSHALCIQWDAFILNHSAWDNSWLQYDYIGAPWWFSDNKNVGNGGFSLRSKKFMKACSELPTKNFHPEDVTMCRVYRKYLESKGIVFAPEEVAAKFAIEGNQKYGRTWNGQFGFHDLEMTDISKWAGYENYIQIK